MLLNRTIKISEIANTGNKVSSIVRGHQSNLKNEFIYRAPIVNKIVILNHHQAN